MRCNACNGDSRVLDSRPAEGGDAIRRRRECPACGRRFSTVERAERARLFVVKRGGERQEFDRAKVFDSMKLAANKRRVSTEALDLAAARIEKELARDYDDEVPSREIGARVMRELSLLDPVAYVRFASVYGDLETLSDISDLLARVAAEEEDRRFRHLQSPLLSTEPILS